MKKIFGEIDDSAAKHISFRGEHKKDNVIIYRKLPKLGDYILYNEHIKCHIHSGTPCFGKRGIGRVVKYIGHLIYIDVYSTPNYIRHECFQIDEFRVGLIEYVRLSNKLYVGKESGYTRADLNIRNPHPDIRSLYQDQQNKKDYNVLRISL